MARSRKAAIELISLFMLLVKFFSDVFKSVNELNGKKEDVYIFFALEDGAKSFAELIISKTKKAIQTTAQAVLQSLSTLMTALNLDWKNDNITEANFPALPEDEIEYSKKEFKLYNFTKTVSSQHALQVIEKDGFRPATVREQLQWAKDHWNRKDWITALGQMWLDSIGDHRVSVLDRRGGECKLFLGWFGDDWSSDYQFLTVRK